MSLKGKNRTMTNEKGETFFVGKDVATALGYSDPQKAIKMHVDNDDKLTRQFVVSGQNRNIIIINALKCECKCECKCDM